MKLKQSFGGRLFDISNHMILGIYALITVIPFIYIISASFATTEELIQKGFILFPTKFTFETYKYIFSTPTLPRSLGVTVFITVAGTMFGIFMTVLFAYPLAHKNIVGRRFIMAAVVFTMLFNPGLVPHFLTIRLYSLIDSYLSLILPGAISTFSMIIIKNFFQQIPSELEESARMDGGNDLMILISIIIPLSTAVMATFSLFYAVGYWNSFLAPVLYINDYKKWPIQVLLRQIVIESQPGIGNRDLMSEKYYIPPQTVKMATIAVATIPIMLVYPFLQKHFIKGVMLGSIKG